MFFSGNSRRIIAVSDAVPYEGHEMFDINTPEENRSLLKWPNAL